MKNEKNILKKIGNDLPFSVPENYFEQFANEIDLKIGYTKKIEVPKSETKGFIRSKAWMPWAAVFVGIFLLGNVFYFVSKNNERQKQENYEMYLLSQVDEPTMMYYYMNDAYEAENGSETFQNTSN
ncbi:MAG: hypothetical protein KBG17_03495 [Paludibacteraceae bacterium]|nr:hypothetical protein [Paludibacteraceae bacterium]